MQMHDKKQVTVILARPLLERLKRILSHDGVSGWTVLPAHEGSGAAGNWSRDGVVSEAFQMVCVISIIDPTKLDRILEDVLALIDPGSGVVTVQDVQVVRSGRF
jgi:PII-like signaling protein